MPHPGLGRVGQVATVPAEIEEDRDLPVRLAPWLRQEAQAGDRHALVSSVEVVDAEEGSRPARRPVRLRSQPAARRRPGPGAARSLLRAAGQPATS